MIRLEGPYRQSQINDYLSCPQALLLRLVQLDVLDHNFTFIPYRPRSMSISTPPGSFLQNSCWAVTTGRQAAPLGPRSTQPWAAPLHSEPHVRPKPKSVSVVRAGPSTAAACGLRLMTSSSGGGSSRGATSATSDAAACWLSGDRAALMAWRSRRPRWLGLPGLQWPPSRRSGAV